MIIKLFDIYSQATKDLLLGTARLFKEFTIYKPATSRPCNSERYFSARGFQGQTPSTTAWIRHLQEAQIKHTQSPLTQLVGSPWPQNMIDALQEQIDYQEQQQITIIQETLTFTMDRLPQKVKESLEKSMNWCRVFGVPMIS